MEISALPLFRGVPAEELPALLARASARTCAFQKGELLLRRGDVTRRLGLVLEGSVHIIREDFWGNRSIVGLAGPGEVFAESYALAGEPLEVSVLAAAPGAALFLEADGLTDARLTANLLHLLARKNLMLTRKMRHMARRTTRDKLLSYLSAQALAAGSSEFDIPMDRQQLADYLSVDRSAMSAALGKLRDEGVLTFRKNHFRLLGEERD
ncbi:Crp/Fnr family transcriptional regulator [Oscillibacter valericigenes]|uniref:Crp/Fnr family transcriptional regulator n=1 Tax=Oscillibacter valericigenes TaxID=351091 RepID=UPI001F459893|nr:Crp/Fnr family transcriptional regulator [Oscillibacter valericigenes]MCF2617251.1 Crp/Fnr family transcriptional regulator [Oscillibacter valericigenes]